jgi:flagellar biosynthetic protein FliQ
VTPDDVVAVGRQALEMMVVLSAPILVTSLVVGVLISVFQAVTQIQEQTLSFIPKILAVAATLFLTLPWMLNSLVEYTREILLGLRNVLVP